MKEPKTLLDNARPRSARDDLPVDRQRPSGLVLQKVDVPIALKVLDCFLQEDETEQQETLGYLMKALNQTRTAQGERRIFSDE